MLKSPPKVAHASGRADVVSMADPEAVPIKRPIEPFPQELLLFIPVSKVTAVAHLAGHQLHEQCELERLEARTTASS